MSWLLEGLIALPWWGYVAVTLVLTHITIASVTIYLHRHQAHRALDLHPTVAHFFRFWLWLTTGMITKQWVAVHRKHHAYSDKPGDPHSPMLYGIRKVLLDGVDLYRREVKNSETLAKYGHNTPDDWIESRLYSRFPSAGIVLMLGIDLVCFGPIGLTVWAVQMMWIPFFAAGVINGAGHYWGYRNYEVADTSTNIVPWGILIGGEELHNNHHAFASSAKFSSKWWEFDIGWLYIRMLELIGLARVKKLPPEIVCDNTKQHIDLETVRAVVAGRLLVMRDFAREVLYRIHREELKTIAPVADRQTLSLLKRARRLLVREATLLDEVGRRFLQRALEASVRLRLAYHMKERLAEIWRQTHASQEHLIQALQAWCREAEDTGIEALQQFSRRLRAYRLMPAAA
jgi:stearoyl-CoA desaturase (delta-9 desaturase)